MVIRALGGYSYGEWESYFTWYPTRTINKKWYWFQKIYRRQYLFKPLWVYGYQYATIFEILQLDN